MGRFDIETIPYGLEQDVFRPRNRSNVRDLFGIPDDAFVLLCVAESLTQPRKGFRYVHDAIQDCVTVPNLYLLAIGGGEAELPAGVSGRVLPSTCDDRLLSFVYSAADVFVIPSLQDNFPNTVLEAIACGVPVIGFDVGGIRDMVRPNETGLLVKPKDTPALAQAIKQLADDASTRSRLALNCRRTAEAEYGARRQAQSYADLYHRICADRVSVSTVTELNAVCHA